MASKEFCQVRIDRIRSTMAALRSTLKQWHLQHAYEWWPLALGGVMGIGVGAWALWGIGGALGVGVCLLVPASAIWLAKDAEPVFIPSAVSVTVALAATKSSVSASTFIEPLAMVELPGGTFYMGFSDDDETAYNFEKPQHEVTVSSFAMSFYTIDRQLYRKIRAIAPEEWEADEIDERLPATFVSWFDAVRFCNALSESVGLQPCYHIEGEQVTWDLDADGYRLPTEAEWEYACRAGTTSSWFWGNDESLAEWYAWFEANSDNQVHRVGEKEPNPFGLYDMSGNVWEWCWDWLHPYSAEPQHDPRGPEHGEGRVLRGGAWGLGPVVLRSADRFRNAPVRRDDDVGFRCVRRPRRQL